MTHYDITLGISLLTFIRVLYAQISLHYNKITDFTITSSYRHNLAL